MFRKSFRELKNVRCLAVTGVLVAVYIALKAYGTVSVFPSLRISFAFIALAAIGMLYGPVVAVIAAIPCDIIGLALLGGGFIPEFTFIIMFEGFVYGSLLYGFELKRELRRNAKLIAAQAVVVFICHLVFNTAALYHNGFIGGDNDTVLTLITARLIKNVIEFPVDIILLYFTLVPIKIAYGKTMKEG